MSALKVLERAEQLGLLEPKLIADLRKQVSESKWSMTPEAIVKLLVDRGHLTPFQARNLVTSAGVANEEDEVVELEAVDEPAPAKPTSSKAGPAKGSPAKGRTSKDGTPKDKKREEEIEIESALPPTPATSIPTQVTIRPNQPVNQEYLMAAGKPSPDEPEDDTELKLVNEPPAAPAAPTQPPSSKQPGKLPNKKKSPSPPAMPEGLVPVSPAVLTPVSPPALVPHGLTPVASPGVPYGAAPSPYPPSMVPVSVGADLVGNAFSHGQMGPTSGYAPVMTQQPASIDTWGSVVEPAKTAKKRTEKRVAPTMENPWILGGAGALIVLVLVLGALVFSLGRTSADKLLDAGNAAYKSGAYSQAIGIFEQFEKNYGSDPNVSAARVKKGMASIRQVFDGQRDMARALAAAQEFLPKIEGEAKFEIARAELESMLPDIADNFAAQADSTPDTSRKDKLVKLSEEALRLCDNPAYLPQTRKEAQRPRLDRIREQLAVARRKIDQDTDLLKAIDAMNAATKSGDTGAAYTARADLLVRYPGLDADPRMVTATENVSVAERKLVTVGDKPSPTVDPPSFEQGKSTVLASRVGEPLAELQGKTLLVGVNGSTFGLDAATGRVLWRRTMGTTRVAPVYLGAVGASDAIVSNEQDQCVERVEAATGKVMWRFPIGERFFTPVVGGTDLLFVTTESGVVHEIDAVSGASPKRAKLPQKATSSPAYDARRKVLYQVGESGSLFALAGDTLGGRDGYYLGHRAGGVTTAPLVVSGHVIVCENNSRGVVLVHVLNTDKRGYEFKKAIEPIAMTGQMVQPASAYGRRVVVLTSSGEALILEIDVNNDDTPIDNAVREVVRQPAASANTAVVGYQLLDGPRLWVADTRLARYEVVASRSALNRGPATWDGDSFIAPMQKIEGNIVTVRRKGGTGPATVQLVRIESDEALWATDVGSAPQWIGVAGDRVHAITSSGNHFALPVADSMPVSADTPTTRITPTLGAANFSQKASYGKSGVALVDPARGLMLAFDPAAKSGRPIATKMKLGDAKVAGPVGSFGDGVLVPMSGGKIMLFDPAKGEPKETVLPLFPEAAPGQTISWLQPQIYGDEAKRFVAVDSRRQLFLAGLVDRPQGALAEQGRVEGEYQFVGGVSLSGDRLYTVQREGDGDTLVVYSMPGITEVAKHKLGGRLGPRGVSTSGGLTFVEVDKGELWAFEKGNDPIWKAPLPAGVLASDPRVVGAEVILAHQLGSVVSLGRADGAAKGLVKVGEPLSPAVAETNNSLYVGTLSGAIHRVELPLPASAEGATR
jgi:outer membrane protein assembly factor BamB